MKLNISNFHKAVIPRTKSVETLKNCSSINNINQNCSLHNLFDVKSGLKIDIHKSFYLVYCRAGTMTCCQLKDFFYLPEGKV